MSNPLAAMLDELMGKHRNANPDEAARETTFEDEDICKPFLVGYCPNEMFINTKADLGPCTKVHDEKYRTQYRKSEKFEKQGYEEDFMSFLMKMQGDMDRKIKRNRERLDLTQPDGQATDSNKDRLEHKIEQLDEKITEYLEKAEELGNSGRVDESVEATRVADRYKLEKEQVKKNLMNLGGSPEDVKPMEVCEVCGCFLIVGDAQQRIEEHMTGKQHMGYAKIRATIQELQRRKEEKRAEEAEKRRTSLDRDRDRERDRDRRETSRSSDKTRARDDRKRDSDRDRSTRKRSRSRSRDRDPPSKRSHGSGSKDRDRHSSSHKHRRSSRERESRRHTSSSSSSHRHDRDKDKERRRRDEKEHSSTAKEESGKKEAEKVEEGLREQRENGVLEEPEGTPNGRETAGEEQVSASPEGNSAEQKESIVTEGGSPKEEGEA